MINNLNDFGKIQNVTDMKNPNCDNCNDCCTMMAAITKQELGSIVDYILNNKRLIDYTIGKIFEYKLLLENEKILNWTCLFSDQNKKCAIYDIRPSICKNFHCSKGRASGDGYTEVIMIINIIFSIILSYKLNIDKGIDMIMSVYQHSFEKYIDNIKING
jgi:Fe-S-cluster containining protein